MVYYQDSEIYSDEIADVPPSVVEVETALPAFVGYTAKAARKLTDDLLLRPAKINSMREFESLFGLPFENEIEVAITAVGSEGKLLASFKETSLQYILYYSVKIYFDNGGGPCYILSVDTYHNPQQVLLRRNIGSQHHGLLDGLNKLKDIADVSLIVIPEAVKLSVHDYSSLVQAALLQCHTLDNRFAIFDLYNGDLNTPDLNLNRGLFGSKYLNYGSAYYPFVRTTINSYVNTEGSNVKVTFSGKVVSLGQLKTISSQLYKFVKNELKNRFINLPSCGAVAGAYVTSDKNRGVWKSPANLNLSCVSEPVVKIDNFCLDIQNMDPDTGKSMNSIRTSSGKGTLLWGARTLAIDDNEDRHVSSRRFIIMVRESIRTSTSWVVFEPNDTCTWIKICRTIENYLSSKWLEGALAGVTTQQAYYVKCGLGITMTSQDIQEGRINVEVGLAVLAPSEFTVFKFSHQLNLTKSYLTRA